MFFRDILMYVFDLFKMSWNALPSAINKNAIIPSFIASVISLVIVYFCWFVEQILRANGNSLSDMGGTNIWLSILIIVLTLPMCWGFATVASVIKAKNEGKDDSWRNHTSVGFKGVKFFVTYVLAVVALFLGITILSSIGLMPIIGKPILSLLAVPFYFASIVIILCTIGLTIGSHMFGGFYLSGDYDESAGFKDKTVSLIKMIGCKVVDFIGVTIPAGVMMLLFVILPTILMVSAVNVMQMPGKDFYDIRWPNVYMALANTNQYPAENSEESSDMLNLSSSTEYPWRYPTVEDASTYYGGTKGSKGFADRYQKERKEIQDEYKKWQDYPGMVDGKMGKPNKGKDFGEYVDWLNESDEAYMIRSFGDFENEIFDANEDAFSYSGDQLIINNYPGKMPNRNPATCYVSQDEIECTSAWDSNHIWSMDGAGKDVSFGGESHPSFFIWLITFILVFVCSIIVSVPLGCLYSAGGSIYYSLYTTDYHKKYGLVKRLLAILILPVLFGIWFASLPGMMF
tara:strand:- start:1709 stop:3250 length:1542 start_codon:yes stop_codon:yes gene_type:complete